MQVPRQPLCASRIIVELCPLTALVFVPCIECELVDSCRSIIDALMEECCASSMPRLGPSLCIFNRGPASAGNQPGLVHWIRHQRRKACGVHSREFATSIMTCRAMADRGLQRIRVHCVRAALSQVARASFSTARQRTRQSRSVWPICKWHRRSLLVMK